MKKKIMSYIFMRTDHMLISDTDIGSLHKKCGAKNPKTSSMVMSDAHGIFLKTNPTGGAERHFHLSASSSLKDNNFHYHTVVNRISIWQ